jgi:ubiquinone/menaquinone biosynthesis C-methylase UbiE
MKHEYLMESEDEVLRLDKKTDGRIAEDQALWAGIKPGMRVADLGCGSGRTTFHLYGLVQPGGRAVGVDISDQRVIYAKENYIAEHLEFKQGDIRNTLADLGQFDFVFIRFVLEYYREGSFEIVKNTSEILKPGGILCLIDLDCNSMRHFGLSPRLEQTLSRIMNNLEKIHNFDPYAGVKLYSYLYDLSYKEIDVHVTSHNLIFNELTEKDRYNWTKKVLIAGKKSDDELSQFRGGFEEFFKEFTAYFENPRRFTYTPLILCRGRKPAIR